MSQTPSSRLSVRAADAAASLEASAVGVPENGILVGEIVAPFGIKGQVKIVPLMENPAALIKLPFVTLRPPTRSQSVQQRKVTAVRTQPNAALVTLDGVDDRNAAEALRGSLIFIGESELPPLGPDTYYEKQLIGLQVVTDAGRDLGVIEKVHFYPANDVYETPVALIPAVEAFIVSVDLAGGRMVVRDVAGLRKDE